MACIYSAVCRDLPFLCLRMEYYNLQHASWNASLKHSSSFIRRVAINEFINFWDVLEMLREDVPAFLMCVCWLSLNVCAWMCQFILNLLLGRKQPVHTDLHSNDHVLRYQQCIFPLFAYRVTTQPGCFFFERDWHVITFWDKVIAFLSV